MKITFIFDTLMNRPCGGAKVIYQYANYFAERGHYVTILYSDRHPLRRLEKNIPFWIRVLVEKVLISRGSPWFELHDVHTKFIATISERTVPDGDVIFATAVTTAPLVSELSMSKGKKFYMIQDFENWNVSNEQVYSTYKLGMKNIVIADWLAEEVKKTGAEVTFIPNGIDTLRFRVHVANEDRYCHSVAMIYQKNPVKGFEYGYRVLWKLHERYPDLKCYVFGTAEREDIWPDWINYTYNATESELIEIYNQAAVFISSSIIEGFGLCAAESMACGCALAATAYGGIFTYAVHGQNALISPVKDVDALYKNVCRLFEDADLRKRISETGNITIQNLSWQKAYKKMDDLLEI